MKYLVDTNIFIYHFNGESVATEFLLKNAGDYFISFVTYIELLGFPDIDAEMSEKIENFLENIDLLSIDNSIMNQSIKNRKYKKIKLADNIIASTALTNNLTLVTRNTADFNSLEVDILNPFA